MYLANNLFRLVAERYTTLEKNKEKTSKNEKKTVTPCSHSFDLCKMYSFILQIEFYREYSEENTIHNTSKKNISISRSRKQKIKLLFFPPAFLKTGTLFDAPIS